MMETMRCLHLRLVVLLLCSFCVSVHASIVEFGGFTTHYGTTGCLYEPKDGCGRKGDTCYDDGSNAYAITGTAPSCNACMPKGFRNIATFKVPSNLPCALWRAYDCDDYFVTNVYYKTGSNSCWMAGYKSYNIENTFSSAQESQDTFLQQCRQRKTFADYGLPADTKLITERDFCFPQHNNIIDITIAAVGTQQATVLTNYKECYEQKFNVVVKSTDEN